MMTLCENEEKTIKTKTVHPAARALPTLAGKERVGRKPYKP
jgi:hypothetical protein